MANSIERRAESGVAATENQSPAEAAMKMFTGSMAEFWDGRAPQNPLEYWLSFSPMAPLWGLRWSVLDMMRQADPSVFAAVASPAGATAAPARDLGKHAIRSREEQERLSSAGNRATVTPMTKKQSGKADHLRLIADQDATPAKMSASKMSGAKASGAKTPAAKSRSANMSDDFTRIKGVGPKLANLLNDNGVDSFAKLARMKVADFQRLDEKLGAFKGRWRRDDWARQAKRLMR